MRIAFLISGWRAPSTRFRVLQYAPRLRAMGIECDLYASAPEKYRRAPLLGWRVSAALRRARWLAHVVEARGARLLGRPADVVFVEREVLAEDSLWFERQFRKLAPRMVLDVDDAIHLQRPDKMKSLAALVDQVIAGNAYLADAYRADARRPPIIVPACIDTALYAARSEPRAAARPVVGWMGTPSNLPYFEPILGALRKLSGEREYELRLVTDERAPRFTLDWQGIPVVWRRWASATEAADVREFDIGLMPLVDDPWTRGKCGLKAIQYLAAGVPAVVSPVGVNREIVRDGQNGYWAETPEQWLERLRRLLDDPSERARLGAKGREHVERHYSIQAWFEPWLKAVLGRSSP